MAKLEESSYPPEIVEAWNHASDSKAPMLERNAAAERVAAWMKETTAPLDERVRASEEGC
ncbi:MAG: hypothetical protein ACD_28C00091G0002 [uncultured bacterium]|nr:MAG: hypothetical protein ACD_28C00091G0002 [uncultured bacterium]